MNVQHFDTLKQLWIHLETRGFMLELRVTNMVQRADDRPETNEQHFICHETREAPRRYYLYINPELETEARQLWPQASVLVVGSRQS